MPLIVTDITRGPRTPPYHAPSQSNHSQCSSLAVRWQHSSCSVRMHASHTTPSLPSTCIRSNMPPRVSTSLERLPMPMHQCSSPPAVMVLMLTADALPQVPSHTDAIKGTDAGAGAGASCAGVGAVADSLVISHPLSLNALPICSVSYHAIMQHRHMSAHVDTCLHSSIQMTGSGHLTPWPRRQHAPAQERSRCWPRTRPCCRACGTAPPEPAAAAPCCCLSAPLPPGSPGCPQSTCRQAGRQAWGAGGGGGARLSRDEHCWHAVCCRPCVDPHCCHSQQRV